MKRFSIFLLALVLGTARSVSLQAQEAVFSSVIPTQTVGDVTLVCPAPSSWHFAAEVERLEGKEYISLTLRSEAEAIPPLFTLSFAIPQRDIHHLWEINGSARFKLAAEWNYSRTTNLSSGMPLFSFINDRDENRLTVASDEVYRDLVSVMALKEEGCLVVGKMTWFSVPESPMTEYRTKICLDGRRVFWADAAREASLWMRSSAGCEPCPVPEAAYEPLYSTWYQFHQDVYADQVEAECEKASALGMKTIIVDDGWQVDQATRGYARCGDWEVSARRFPDFKSHIRRVQAMGMKYMLWYSVPFIGSYSRNYERFKHAVLYSQKDFYDKEGDLTVILDPRFPEVRSFLIGLYVDAARNWGLDGFKLDFIDSFRLKGKDPALKDNYAGRDIRSVPEAVNVLMRGVRDSLLRINPEVLLEFRQRYVGPAITQYGNMFRASDCPGELQQNRIAICNLRVGAPGVAIHSDMIEWHPTETAAMAARAIQSALFGVVQYSVMLRDIPQEHLDVIRFWLDFSRKHRSALLKGWFKPHHPEAAYPLVEAGDARETIKALYQPDVVVPVEMEGKAVYVLNASGADGMVLKLSSRPKSVKIFDMYGKPVSTATGKKCASGLCECKVPAAGFLLVE